MTARHPLRSALAAVSARLASSSLSPLPSPLHRSLLFCCLPPSVLPLSLSSPASVLPSLPSLLRQAPPAVGRALGLKVSRGLQLQSLWITPAAAVS